MKALTVIATMLCLTATGFAQPQNCGDCTRRQRGKCVNGGRCNCSWFSVPDWTLACNPIHPHDTPIPAACLTCCHSPLGKRMCCYVSPDPACCKRATCIDNFPGQCGTFPDGCGGVLNCGCPGGGVCSAGKCCAVKTCSGDYPRQCGFFSDGCGDNITCGCAGPQICVSGSCYPPYVPLFKVKCPGGTQTIAGSSVPVSGVRMRKGGTIYDVLLVPVGDSDQSCVNVRVSTNTMRMMKM